jgi:hypothetical protein
LLRNAPAGPGVAAGNPKAHLADAETGGSRRVFHNSVKLVAHVLAGGAPFLGQLAV